MEREYVIVAIAIILSLVILCGTTVSFSDEPPMKPAPKNEWEELIDQMTYMENTGIPPAAKNVVDSDMDFTLTPDIDLINDI